MLCTCVVSRLLHGQLTGPLSVHLKGDSICQDAQDQSRYQINAPPPPLSPATIDPVRDYLDSQMKGDILMKGRKQEAECAANSSRTAIYLQQSPAAPQTFRAVPIHSGGGGSVLWAEWARQQTPWLSLEVISSVKCQ